MLPRTCLEKTRKTKEGKKHVDLSKERVAFGIKIWFLLNPNPHMLIYPRRDRVAFGIKIWFLLNPNPPKKEGEGGGGGMISLVSLARR